MVMTVVMSRRLAETLQRGVISAARKAMLSFQKKHKIQLEEFTCFGFKRDGPSNWIAYVAIHLKKNVLKNVSYELLMDEVYRKVLLGVNAFEVKHNQNVGINAIRSFKETAHGLNIAGMGFHWLSEIN